MKKTDDNDLELEDITVDGYSDDDADVGGGDGDDAGAGAGLSDEAGAGSSGDSGSDDDGFNDAELAGDSDDDSTDDLSGDSDDVDSASGSTEDFGDVIKELSQELIEKLGFKAVVEVTQEDSVYRIHIKTDEDASMLIGKHARMLSSLQRVMSAMLFNKLGEKADILVDVNDYRDAQKERLIGIADSVAQRVIDEGRPSRLSSFSAYERKIIHEHISENYHSLESFSEGEGRFRKLVIGRKQSA